MSPDIPNLNYSGDLSQWLGKNFGYGGLTGLDSALGVLAGGQPTFVQNGVIYGVKDNGNGQYSVQQVDTVANRNGQYQEQQYQQQQGSAISTLQTGKQNLAGQYSDLLKTVTGEYQPLIDQATMQQNAQNASRGLVSNVGNGGTQMISALNPIYSAQAANAQQLGAGSISDTNTYNQAISAAQQSGAQFGANLSLNVGSLSTLLPSEAAANYGQANQAFGANAAAISQALIKANTPQMASNGIVFAPTAAPSSNTGYYYPSLGGGKGGGGKEMSSIAMAYLKQQRNNKKQPAATISQYVQ